MGGGNSTPQQRDPVNDANRAIDLYLRRYPELLSAEQRARIENDPQRIEQNLALLETYDPDRLRTYNAMGRNVREGVESGYDLPPALRREGQQAIRGAQVARGNVLGNAPANQEAVFSAGQAYDMYNRRLAQAGTFMEMGSPMAPDRSAQYTAGGNISNLANMGAGWGQQQFSQQLASQQPSRWSTALAGGATGAAAGASAGPWGAAIGGVVGAGVGYFSTRELKHGIEKVGESPSGLNIYEFSYINDTARYRGVIAEEIEAVKPEAVKKVGAFKAVNYDLIDVDFQRV